MRQGATRRFTATLSARSVDPVAEPSVLDAFSTLEYGPAPEDADVAIGEWLENGSRTFGHYVGGRWIDGDGDALETRCPGDGRLLARFRRGTVRDVDRAVAAAREAAPAWRALGPAGRARALYGMARALQRRSRLFAVLESLDNGKSIRESRDLDVPLAARHFHHHAGWAQVLRTEFPDTEPLGVIGQIVPWNFPLLMLAWKVAPALAAGNATVLKPAEQTPLTALLFAELVDEVGIPPGVLNVVTGDGTTGAALVRHADVDKIAFTGSTEVGREIRRATAGSRKSLSLELGGKSPFVVFESADLDAAVEGVVDGVWLNQGEVCCAGSRLLVQEGVEAEMYDRLRARMETLRLGHPLDKSIDMGAIVDGSQVERIERYLELGRRDGATVWQSAAARPESGHYVPPTLCVGAPPSSPIATDEVFGPVLVGMSFRTPAEAVALANDTRYGLAASVWTEDVSLALDVAPKLKAGTVWINCTNRFDAAAGFGGYRESGFGREGGAEGMWEYRKPAPRAARFGSETNAGAGDAPNAENGRAATDEAPRAPAAKPVDRTRKLWIGGRQTRSRSGHSLPVRDSGGALAAEIPRANRKDARDAVEAASEARASWARSSGHLRAQVLHFVAENLAARSAEFVAELGRLGVAPTERARAEVAAAGDHVFAFGAWADKNGGRVNSTPFANVAFAMNEAVGTVVVRCGDDAPLAGVAGAIAAAASQGNVVVAIAPERRPLPALDLVQVLEASDVPPGVVNVLSGLHREIVPTLAAHDDVDQLWDFVGDDLSAESERLSAGNLKRVWVDWDRFVSWGALSPQVERLLLRNATQVKNVWAPYGV